MPKADRLLKWDFAARVLAQRNALIVPSPRRAPSGFETYVRSRVHGVSQEPNWLDAFPVRAAIASCNAIGATAAFGGKHNRNLLTDDQWWEASGKGFEIASAGPDAIAAFLRDHQVPTYGSLHLWLCSVKASDPIYDPFREILTRHFVDTVAFNPNARMFGKPLPAREIHSVVSAAQEFGIFRKFIRRIVLARLPEAEMEQDKTDGELTFKAADFGDEFRRLASALLVRDLPPYAGCKPRTAQTLVRKGFIKPILAPNGDRPGILRFAREDVDAFLGRLSARAEIVPEAPEGALPIALSPANIPCTVEVVINLILAGELSWLGRLESVHGFDGLLVDASEVRKKALGPAPGALTFHQAFHIMGVGGGAFHRLVRAGVVELLPITQPGNRPATPYIAFDEVVRFRKKYVSLPDVSKLLSINYRHIKPALDAAGIHALDLGLVPLGLYEREHVARVFPSIMEHIGSPEILPRTPRTRAWLGTSQPKGGKPSAQRKRNSAISATGKGVRVNPRVRMRRAPSDNRRPRP
ncbi:hypothetical protein FQV39_08015 [Bosea sp. F3-2]|uniref:hypothetical protein n=1 Tax=Bosea sp. F3-2 TaxID=2599640 RepID=UPI0011ED4A99|nr:hypothetical protein [Bosea sp. F3-2]QEL22512.1 hypothetical protein FQV39_08015 [Bosea sp. F3-2]